MAERGHKPWRVEFGPAGDAEDQAGVLETPYGRAFQAADFCFDPIQVERSPTELTIRRMIPAVTVVRHQPVMDIAEAFVFAISLSIMRGRPVHIAERETCCFQASRQATRPRPVHTQNQNRIGHQTGTSTLVPTTLRTSSRDVAPALALDKPSSRSV